VPVRAFPEETPYGVTTDVDQAALRRSGLHETLMQKKAPAVRKVLKT
jgi:hypothetical protein